MAVPVKNAFLLKGINPNLIEEEYSKGGSKILERLTIKKRQKIDQVTLTNNKGKSSMDPLFSFKDKDNFIQTIATTNAKNFSFFSSEGVVDTKEEKICQSCYRRFTHEAMGIPVSLEEHEDKIIIFTSYVTHSFACTLRLIHELDRRLSTHRRINLIHAEQFLKFLYRKMHPKANPLQPAPDPSLLQDNGGSLTQEEYDSPKYVYKHIPNIILYPAKEQYLSVVAS